MVPVAESSSGASVFVARIRKNIFQKRWRSSSKLKKLNKQTKKCPSRCATHTHTHTHTHADCSYLYIFPAHKLQPHHYRTALHKTGFSASCSQLVRKSFILKTKTAFEELVSKPKDTLTSQRHYMTGFNLSFFEDKINVQRILCGDDDGDDDDAEE